MTEEMVTRSKGLTLIVDLDIMKVAYLTAADPVLRTHSLREVSPLYALDNTPVLQVHVHEIVVTASKDLVGQDRSPHSCASP
jgi:hypothetical protein